MDLYVDMVFNKSVECQFTKFRTGFQTGCPLLVWKMFLPEELMTLLHGDNQYEWEELRKVGPIRCSEFTYYKHEPGGVGRLISVALSRSVLGFKFVSSDLQTLPPL